MKMKMKMKSKSKKQNEYVKGDNIIAIGILILFVSLGVFSFMIFESGLRFKTGKHNVDLGSNMRFLEERYNIDLVDYGDDEVYRDGAELMVLGYNQIESGFKSGIWFAFLFGYFFAVILVLVLFLVEKLKKLKKNNGN